MKLTAIKIDKTMQGDREIQPPVKCFCCQDSGLVRSSHLKEYVDGENDLDFICNRLDCESGQKYQNAYFCSDHSRKEIGIKHGMTYMKSRDYQLNFDPRLDAFSCEKLHDKGLEDWRGSLKGSKKVSLAISNAIAISEAVRNI